MIPQVSRSDIIALEKKIVADQGLYGFVRVAWKHVEASPFTDNWHIPLLCAELEALTASKDEEKKLLVNMPPGFTKSLLCSVLWPAYSWMKDPSTRWIYGSFDESLAVGHARLSRALLTSPWFEARWGSLGIDPSSGDTEYHTRAGGWRFSTSVGGKATGRHADFICIDDPNKPSELTPVMLAKTIDWRRRILSTRERNPGKTKHMCVMQRLHRNDLASDCLEDGFKQFKLPMHATPLTDPTRYPLDKRAPGELLMPQRANEASVAKLSKTLGIAGAKAQLEQDPNSDDTGLFPVLHSYTRLPGPGGVHFTSWDCAFKDEASSDFVVGGRFYFFQKKLYLLNVWRGQWDINATKAQIEKAHEDYPECAEHIIEDKANGPAVIQLLKGSIKNLKAITPLGSKISRANSISGYVKDGDVLFPESGAWMPELRQELKDFPHGKNDDIVDMISQAAIRYLLVKKSTWIDAV